MRRGSLFFGVVLAAIAAAAAQAAAPPTLTASTRVVAFGGDLVLRGTIPGSSAGQQVQIVAVACGFNGAVPVGETKTTAGGAYSYTLQPMLNATLFVQVGSAQSPRASVRVRPGVQLRRINGSSFGVDVSVGNGTWFTKAVILQRLDPRKKTWVKVASAPLKANSDPEALTAVSSATLHAAVQRGTKLRAVVTQGTVGSCYLPATSPTLTA